MAGLKGNWQAGLRKLMGAMRKIADRDFPKSLNRQIAAQALSLVQQGFRSSTDPYGGAWDPVLRGGKPLRDTGLLANSFSYEATGAGFKIGTPIREAPVHQYGARIRAKRARYLRFRIGRRGKTGPWVMKRAVTIPARAMLPRTGAVPPAWAAAFRRVYDAAMRRALKGK